MTQNWIIDVLADLRSFAEQNQLPELAEALDDTCHVAAGEMALQARGGRRSAESTSREGNASGVRDRM